LSAVLGLTASAPERPAAAERQLAEDVVSAIQPLFSLAKEGDALTRYEERVTRAELAPRVRVASAEWAPERSQDLVKELVERFPETGIQLQEELEGKDLGTTVRGLVQHPPQWVTDGNGLLFEALGSLAESVGEWDVALRAGKEAVQRPGGDRVRALVRAFTAAYVLGRPDEGEQLFAEAKEIEDTHPLVLLREVRLEEDGQRRLDILARVEPRNEKEQTSLQAETAEALGLLDRFEEADEVLSEARQARGDRSRIEEVEAELAVRRNRRVWLRGEQPDVAGLLRAAKVFLKLRDEHRAVGVYQASVVYTTQAADAYIKAGHVDEAGRLLEQGAVLAEELATPSGREQLAEAAVNAHLPHLVDELLPDEFVKDDAGRLIRAMATIHAGSADDALATVPVLDRLVEAGELDFQAAIPRLIAAVEYGAEWSEAAERVVAEREPVRAAVFKGKFYARDKRWGDAERELVPFYEEPRVQHQLLGIALEEGDPEKIARRAKDLLDRAPDYSVRLDSARALLRAEIPGPATTELQRLAADTHAPASVRGMAYLDLTRLALEADRQAQVAELSEAWLAVAPVDPQPAWLHAQSLLRLGRFEDADAFLTEHGLAPESVPQAQLAARIYLLSRPPLEALRGIIELADAQPEPDEDLEMLAVIASLQVGAELPHELAERVNPQRFLELFPDTTLMQALPAPETEEEIRHFVQRLAGSRREVIEQAETGVFDSGDAPVAALAFAASKQVVQLWGRLGRLPIDFGDKTLRDLETADALRALAVGAVWDSSAIFVTGLLSDDVREHVRQALPQSVVPQSVMDDCVVHTTDFGAGDERAELGLDEAGEPLITTWTEDAVRADERRAEEMLARARDMDVEPDAPPDDEGPEATFIRGEELAPQLQVYGATFAVARRVRLPIFSDDRHVRLRARQAGVPAFGTLQLLDALERRDYISADERQAARRALRAANALGTDPSAEELVKEARDNQFRLTVGLANALRDPTVVRVRPADPVRAYLDFLRPVFAEAPERFPDWVARVLDAVQSVGPALSHGRHAQNLLLLAWEPYEDADPAFFQALVKVVKGATTFFGPLGDPVAGATQALARVVDSSPYPTVMKVAIMRIAVDQLPLEERARIRWAMFAPAAVRHTPYGQ
jgi:hypothetical protein